MNSPEDEPLGSSPEQERGSTAAPVHEDVASAEPRPEENGTEQAEEKRKLDLKVEISDVGPCKKHIRIAVAPSETKREFADSLKTVRREGTVPGFRPGRAPRELVIKRFKKEMTSKVKSALLTTAIEQVDSEHKINLIAQPHLDLEAIEIPDDALLGCELRLVASVPATLDGLPRKDKSAIVIARVNTDGQDKGPLHFRVFDSEGKIAVDSNQETLTSKTEQIAELEQRLEALWPPHELTRDEKDAVTNVVTSILDHELVFEVEIEVQPEFELPDYHGLELDRPVFTITNADVDTQFERFIEQYAQEVPKPDGAAEMGDQITADVQFVKDGVVAGRNKELKFRLMPTLRLQDAAIPELGKALLGARIGDTREAAIQVGRSSRDPALQGQTIQGIFRILDLKSFRLPEIDEEFLTSLGFDTVDELRTELRALLERRLDYEQRRVVRNTILAKILERVPFDLPADLVSRQEQSTLLSKVSEMRQAGLSEQEIRVRLAELRADAHEATLRSLKEYFLLAKIAEAEEIKVEEEDLDREIARIADQEDESPRRIRARLEKEGGLEALANQVLERKVIDRILESAHIKDIAVSKTEQPTETVETVDEIVGEEPDQPTEATKEPAPSEAEH